MQDSEHVTTKLKSITQDFIDWDNFALASGLIDEAERDRRKARYCVDLDAAIEEKAQPHDQ